MEQKRRLLHICHSRIAKHTKYHSSRKLEQSKQEALPSIPNIKHQQKHVIKKEARREIIIQHQEEKHSLSCRPIGLPTATKKGGLPSNAEPPLLLRPHRASLLPLRPPPEKQCPSTNNDKAIVYSTFPVYAFSHQP